MASTPSAPAARDERNRRLAIAGGVAMLLAVVVVVQFVLGRRKAA
ncbi:MAG: hypothetical protein ACKOTD_06760 [Phycisphaerales bacterium]